METLFARIERLRRALGDGRWKVAARRLRTLALVRDKTWRALESAPCWAVARALGAEHACDTEYVRGIDTLASSLGAWAAPHARAAAERARGALRGRPEPRRWAGLLAARLDRPDLLELETKHVMLTTLGALIDGHAEITDWIPRDHDPSVRIREPREHPGLPLIVTPFVMETEAAWEAVEAGGVVDRAFVEASPTVEALRAELALGLARVS